MQPRDVEQAGGRGRERRGMLDALEDERRALRVGSEACNLGVKRGDGQPQDVLVELDAARQVAHGEPDGCEAQTGIDCGHT